MGFAAVAQVLEGQVDADAEAARVEMQLGAQEWNMQEIERQQRLQVGASCPERAGPCLKITAWTQTWIGERGLLSRARCMSKFVDVN